MLLQHLPEDVVGLCMLYFTLGELILFANTCRRMKKLSAKAPFKKVTIRTDKRSKLDWVLSYVGEFPLDNLTLIGYAFSNSGLAFIKTPLKELIINTTGMTWHALQYIDCSTLENICFPECTITVQALSCLNKTRVHTLSFVGCVLGEGVMQFLQTFRHLKCLNLSSTKVTDGIKFLSNNVRILYLRDTFISHTAILIISKLSLDYLDIRQSFITLCGEERLRRNMTNCIVHFPVRKNNVLVRHRN